MDAIEVPTGFEPVNKAFAEPPLKPLGYRTIVGKVGLEPTTPSVSARCSNHLSYIPV
jgi:hypothetical protein